MKLRCHISGIYLVYDRYIVYLCLYRTSNSSNMPYTWYIPLISLLFVHFKDFVDSITVALMDQEKIQQALTGDRNFSIACELGVRYPVLKAMLSRDNLHIRTSPLLSLHSMSAELRTFLGGCHCFRAFLTETQHLLFHTSMLLDRSRPLHSAVLTDQARDLAGAAMFTRSTPGCGTLADPSLESQGFRSQKPKGSAERPNLIRPGVLQGPGRPGRLQRKKYDKYIPSIYQSCVPAQ